MCIRDRLPGEETLDELEAHLPADLRLGVLFDAFGQRHRAEVEHQLDEIVDHVTFALAGQVEVVQQAHVELHEMRRSVADFPQTCLAGAKIVIGEAHSDVAEAGGELDQARTFGYRGFMDLDDQVELRPPLAQADQRGEEIFAERFSGMRVGEERKTCLLYTSRCV